MKDNFKSFYQLLYAISTFRLFINENIVQEVRMRCTVYLSLRPSSSHEIWASPGNMAIPLIRPIFFLPIGDRINGIPL